MHFMGEGVVGVSMDKCFVLYVCMEIILSEDGIQAHAFPVTGAVFSGEEAAGAGVSGAEEPVLGTGNARVARAMVGSVEMRYWTIRDRDVSRWAAQTRALR